MADLKLIPGRYYWCKTSIREDGKWILGKASADGLALGVIPVELLTAIHPHPIPTPDEIGCARCGLHKHGCEDSLCQWKLEPPSSECVSDVSGRDSIKSCQNCKFYTADKNRCNHEYWNLCIKRDDEGYVKSYGYHHFR